VIELINLEPGKKSQLFLTKIFTSFFFSQCRNTFLFKESRTTGKHLPAPLPTPIKPISANPVPMDAFDAYFPYDAYRPHQRDMLEFALLKW